MNIEIRQPELEALIQERMASGSYESVEDVLLQALEAVPSPEISKEASLRTGADLVTAMQAMPYKDLDFEVVRTHLPVRDVSL